MLHTGYHSTSTGVRIVAPILKIGIVVVFVVRRGAPHRCGWRTPVVLVGHREGGSPNPLEINKTLQSIYCKWSHLRLFAPIHSSQCSYGSTLATLDAFWASVT